MTVSSTTTKVSYTGNGSTSVFAYTFKIFADAEVNVWVDSVLKTLTTHYTVSGAGAGDGGNITFTSGNTPADTKSVVFSRNIARTQVTDYVENDSFPAETHEAALDKLTFIAQELDNVLSADIFRFAETVTDAGTVTIALNAAARASKLLSFDSSGGLVATQEIGVFTGNWAASTAYVIRDLIKDTSNNKIYICITAHTSSGAQPISSNTDVAKWALIVDAAAAATSATAAATSATTATAQAVISTAQAVIATAKAVLTASDAVDTAADVVSAEAAKTAAETAYDNFDDRYLGQKSSDPSTDNDGASLITGALYFNTSNNVMMVYTGSAWVRTTPTSADQTNINALSASAVIADMAILATTDIVADMAILGTAAIVTDMSILATSDIVTDMSILATSDIVTDMSILGTAAVVEDMSILGTAAVVEDMSILATSDIVTDMSILATPAIVTDMSILGTAAIVEDMSILGTAAVVEDMSILGTAAIVEDMSILGTAAIVTDMDLLGATGVVDDLETCADNLAGISNFAARYRVASSDPTGSLDEGDLAYNSTANVLKYYNGSAWITIVAGSLTDVVQDGSPQLGGDLDLNGNNLDFPTTANISDCLDEDTMSSNSATKICTQQSIKAYADTKTTPGFAVAMAIAL